MQILTLDRYRCERTDLVARESAVAATVVLAVLGAVGLGWALAPLPSVLLRLALSLVGLPCLLVFALMLPGVARAWRGGHWVVRARREGIALNVRSTFNADLPDDDPTVAWFEADELEGVRRITQVRSVPGPDGSSEQRSFTWLELVLAREDTAALEAVLVRERARRGVGRTQFHSYPVEVAGPQLVRVAWSSGNVRLRPALEGFLRALATHHAVLDPFTSTGIDWRALGDEELDDYARTLLSAGRRLDAIRLLRTRRGWELTRARAHLETLERRARAA